MDILEAIEIALLYPTGGARYGTTFKQVLVSNQMLHEGCPLSIQYTNECPPPQFADLVNCGLIQEIEQFRLQLEERVGVVGGELVLSTIQDLEKPTPA